MKGFRAYVIAVLLFALTVGMSSCASKGQTQDSTSNGNVTNPATETPPRASSGYPLSAYEINLYIDESDQGKTFTFGGTERFGFFLDERRHPLTALDISGCSFGHISNWSQNGTGRYPVGYEITGKGSCTVRNGDFSVQIVGRDGS
ncbi:MAG: hypothetical protein ABR507_05480 [Actinomycetota bacterium]|nr:hypothetical protein [Actinomycetota bacterium]